MVSGAPVAVGAQPASEGKGYSVYHTANPAAPTP